MTSSENLMKEFSEVKYFSGKLKSKRDFIIVENTRFYFNSCFMSMIVWSGLR